MNTTKKWKTYAIILFFALISFILCSCISAKETKTTGTDFVLNTVASITIYDEGSERLISECFDLCKKYETILSRTDEDSEIFRLNSREISTVSDETAELISSGLYFSKLSGGSFDISVEPLTSLWNFTAENPSVPSQQEIDKALSHIGYEKISVSGNSVLLNDPEAGIDLGAIAKGYIADKVKEYLISQGVEKAIINLGGNVVCIGGKTSDKGFEVGIQRPFGNEPIAALEITDQSVVTTGTYERFFTEEGKNYHHILNPKSGYPFENGLLSVTIIGEDSTVCDALSTTCFALGLDEGLKLINSMDKIYGVFITEDYKLHFSQNAKADLNIK